MALHWSVMHYHGKTPEMINLKKEKIFLDFKFKTFLPIIHLPLLLDESIMEGDVYCSILVLLVALGKQRSRRQSSTTSLKAIFLMITFLLGPAS